MHKFQYALVYVLKNTNRLYCALQCKRRSPEVFRLNVVNDSARWSVSCAFIDPMQSEKNISFLNFYSQY